MLLAASLSVHVLLRADRASLLVHRGDHRRVVLAAWRRQCIELIVALDRPVGLSLNLEGVLTGCCLLFEIELGSHVLRTITRTVDLQVLQSHLLLVLLLLKLLLSLDHCLVGILRTFEASLGVFGAFLGT